MDNVTVTVQIGNTDNKLTQYEWSVFCKDVDWVVSKLGVIHFSGGSSWDRPWQNACWVFETDRVNINEIKNSLNLLTIKYKQDAIAVTIGKTEFV
jgi:hypothetical protein